MPTRYYIPTLHHTTVYLHYTILLYTYTTPHYCIPTLHHTTVYLHYTLLLYTYTTPGNTADSISRLNSISERRPNNFTGAIIDPTYKRLATDSTVWLRSVVTTQQLLDEHIEVLKSFVWIVMLEYLSL